MKYCTVQYGVQGVHDLCVAIHQLSVAQRPAQQWGLAVVVCQSSLTCCLQGRCRTGHAPPSPPPSRLPVSSPLPARYLLPTCVCFGRAAPLHGLHRAAAGGRCSLFGTTPCRQSRTPPVSAAAAAAARIGRTDRADRADRADRSHPLAACVARPAFRVVVPAARLPCVTPQDLIPPRCRLEWPPTPSGSPPPDRFSC